jgi:hypothetical protein
MLLSILAVFAIVVIRSSNAFCPNSCSGHGNCKDNNQCECYDGWNAVGDCSKGMFDTGIGYALYVLL